MCNGLAGPPRRIYTPGSLYYGDNLGVPHEHVRG